MLNKEGNRYAKQGEGSENKDIHVWKLIKYYDLLSLFSSGWSVMMMMIKALLIMINLHYANDQSNVVY